jgi:hypothetical protein
MSYQMYQIIDWIKLNNSIHYLDLSSLLIYGGYYLYGYLHS